MTVVKELVTSVTSETAFDAMSIKFPHDDDIEMAVLGACMLDKAAFQILRRVLRQKEAFYKEPNQTVYSAMERLANRTQPIDLLTVSNELKEMGLFFSKELLESLPPRKKEHFLLYAVQGAHYLVEMTGRVGSSANIEYHSTILYQLFMRRKAISESFWAIKHAQDLSTPIIDIYERLQYEIRMTNPAKVIRIQSMNDVMDEGEKEPPARWMCGNLVKENEVEILFGDEGTGKSVLAFQMADAVSKGQDLFPEHPDFKNHCEPKLTIFYDFELESSELYSRYSFQKEKYAFNENLKRGSLDPGFLDFEDADELIINEIQRDIEVLEPQFVVIDNMTYISSESQDPSIATKIMKKLLALQKKFRPLTILVIAHTPKRDLSQPIESRHLAGAKNLANFAKTIIGVGKSKKDQLKRYIKHVKCRNGMVLHDETNVIECVLHKERTLLQYEFIATGHENAHLLVKDFSEVENEAITWAYEQRKEKKIPYRQLVQDLKDMYELDWSHTTLMRKCVAYRKEKDLDLDPSERDAPV
jgi:archaellum biogenesis ATPase FlaH